MSKTYPNSLTSAALTPIYSTNNKFPYEETLRYAYLKYCVYVDIYFYVSPIVSMISTDVFHWDIKYTGVRNQVNIQRFNFNAKHMVPE